MKPTKPSDCKKLCEMFAYMAEHHDKYIGKNVTDLEGENKNPYWIMTRTGDDKSTVPTISALLKEILKNEKYDYKFSMSTPGQEMSRLLYYAILKDVEDNRKLIKPEGKKEYEKPSTSKDKARYVVYLVDPFDKRVYLTFNQGTGTREVSDIYEEAIKLRGMLKPYFGEKNLVWDSLPGEKYSADEKYGEKYSKGTVCYIQYDVDTLSSMQDDTKLIEDLKLFIKISDKYFELKNQKIGNAPANEKTVKAVFDESKNRIFYGPPGTGKTKKALETAYKLIGSNGDKDKQIKLIQFHPGYHYSDFVEALDINGKCAPRIFKEFANEARKEPEKNYVLIIDEINRANVAEVFGELLYGLEYRNVEFSTEMSTEPFSVPDNLYVIGTMNTADRSLQNMDYAIRRRFSFEQIKAEVPSYEPMKRIFDKVHDDIVKSVARGVDPEDIMPGISYFTVVNQDHLEYKIKYELIPLLKEYAKDGMFTKMVKLENGESLVKLLKNSETNYSDILINMALDAKNNKGADK